MLSTVNWGIIGVGDVCEVKSAPAMKKIAHSRLVAVMRRDGKKAADYARRHRVAKWYDDADALLNDPNVNAIYIATPPDSHADYTLRAAALGKPVYVEKPMARTYAECQTMIEACEQAGVPLLVAYYRRALPHFLKIKELIDQGMIGAVRCVEIQLFQSVSAQLVASSEDNWRVQPDISGGGYFYDLASHTLDFLDFALGPVREVHGFKANQAGLYPADDIVAASFVFESGVIGNGIWCFTTAEVAQREDVTIIGDRGKITFKTFGSGRIRLERDGHKAEIFDFKIPQHIQQPLIEQIVHMLRGEGHCVSTGITAARTNWVMEQLRNLPEGQNQTS